MAPTGKHRRGTRNFRNAPGRRVRSTGGPLLLGVGLVFASQTGTASADTWTHGASTCWDEPWADGTGWDVICSTPNWEWQTDDITRASYAVADQPAYPEFEDDFGGYVYAEEDYYAESECYFDGWNYYC